MTKYLNKQLNVSVPLDWFLTLERLARQESVSKDTNITSLDLVRQALQKNYSLPPLQKSKE